MIDEGPSPEDLERFGAETAHCPHCGAEIWDQAEACPECHEYLVGGPSSRAPLHEWWRQRWIILVVIAAIVALLLWLL
jgi:hypothetical protein